VSLGERIEARRKAVGIPSQAELARRAGIPQTTMNGLINRPYRWSPHLPRIAQVLQTTVEHLAGETDDPDGEVPAGPLLGADQLEWLAAFDALSVEQRKALRLIARDLALSTVASARLHDNRQSFGMPDQG
jgi:transcriptional regulator with XRE-family HTH domain